MKDRLDLVLKLVIYVYGLICLMSLINIEFNLMIDFINDITFVKCSYSLEGNVFCKQYDYKNYQFVILALIVFLRWIVSGKTIQK